MGLHNLKENWHDYETLKLIFYMNLILLNTVKVFEAVVNEF